MVYAFFKLPCAADAAQTEALNAFLRRYSVLSVQKEWVSSGDASFCARCSRFSVFWEVWSPGTISILHRRAARWESAWIQRNTLKREQRTLKRGENGVGQLLDKLSHARRKEPGGDS